MTRKLDPATVKNARKTAKTAFFTILDGCSGFFPLIFLYQLARAGLRFAQAHDLCVRQVMAGRLII